MRAKSERRQQVVDLLMKGMCNKEIARELNLAEITVKSHLTGFFAELGVKTRLEAVVTLYQKEIEILRGILAVIGRSDNR